MIINIDPYKNTFYSRQLPNGNYRHSGTLNTISFTIDSKTEKTQKEIYNMLEKRSIDSLLACEGRIVTLKE